MIDLSMTKHYLNEHIFILRQVQQCQGPFMDEFAITSEEREQFLEGFLKELAELIEEQRIILDKRYDMIQELSKAVISKSPILGRKIANALVGAIRMKSSRLLRNVCKSTYRRLQHFSLFMRSKKG
jgi:hypothetical protein